MAKNKSNKIKNFFKKLRKKWKNAKKSSKILIIIACTLIVLGVIGLLVVNHYFGLMDTGGEQIPVDDIDNDPTTFDTIYDINTAKSLDELICSWYKNNGEKMYNKNVINVLLVATDTRTDQITDDGNSDTLILVSVNRMTKKISLVSFFRDSYTYANIAGKDYYTKITEIHAYGSKADKTGSGSVAAVKTIENDYKIRIDGYVSINFSGFEKVINALGGVDVPVSKAESAYLASGRSYAPQPPVYVASGDSVHLNGREALWFARIRHLDSDIERTRRQRLVIEAIMSKISSASIGELNNAVTEFLPYMITNFSKTEIIKYGTNALKQGWANFEISQVDMPGEDARTGHYVGSKWMWLVDYPLAAQQLQTALYGNTNIVLQTNRVTAIDLKGTAKKADPKPSDSDNVSEGIIETELPAVSQASSASNVSPSNTSPYSTKKETSSSESSSKKQTPASSSQNTSSTAATEKTTKPESTTQKTDPAE